MGDETTQRAIAQALRTIREGKGFSAAEAAEKLHRSRQTIYNWENGTRTPDAVDLYAAANAYEVDPGDFYASLKTEQDPLAEVESALNRARAVVRSERKRSRPEE
jgi:transcriptional regulator with XRE-family HTH domain